MSMTDTFIKCDTETLLHQIGLGNVMGISGGRFLSRPTGVTLPVGHGYRVTVDLAADDTYTVRRIFERAGETTIKGERLNVYCDEVGEVAYQASCYENVEF